MSQVEQLPLYRVDDLRRFIIALGVASGLSPIRASSFASYVLWFDAAGFRAFGVNALAAWLRRMHEGQFDVASEGKIEVEHPGTVVLDAHRGLPPLILSRAASLASEKARDVGLSLVRVKGLAPCGPCTPIAAELAIGPEIGAILGPEASASVAIPSPDGLPVIFDTALADATTESQAPAASKGPSPFHFLPGGLPWSLFAPGEGIHVIAVAVKAFEPLATFHDRVGAALRDQQEAAGVILPAAWDARRRETRERGISIEPQAWGELQTLAAKLDVALPEVRPEASEPHLR